jgi:hypothetical protein
MNLKPFTMLVAMSTAGVSSARAALLHMEFAGGGNEVIMLPGETVQIDIIWTMHPLSCEKTISNSVIHILLSGTNSRVTSCRMQRTVRVYCGGCGGRRT